MQGERRAQEGMRAPKVHDESFPVLDSALRIHSAGPLHRLTDGRTHVARRAPALLANTELALHQLLDGVRTRAHLVDFRHRASSREVLTMTPGPQPVSHLPTP